MMYRHTSHLHGDYVNGDLSTEQQQTVDRHLAECADCRDDFEKIRKLTQALNQLPAPDPGTEYFSALNEIIMARTAAISGREQPSYSTNGKNNRGRRILTTLIKLAAAVTLLFTAFYISDFNQEKRATRWAEYLQRRGVLASEGEEPEYLSMPPAGINMFPGLPSPAEAENGLENETNDEELR